MQKITKRADGSLNIETINNEPSMTQQQFKDETDINLIVEKYSKSGQFPQYGKIGIYADYSEIKDYQGMLQTVMDAQESFNQLDAKVRYKFQNDPAQLIKFMQDPKNHDEGVKLGIYNPKPPKEEIPTPTPTPKT